MSRPTHLLVVRETRERRSFYEWLYDLLCTRRGAFLLTIGMAAALLLVQIALRPWYRLTINHSDSLPGWLFLVDVGVLPHCGELVVVAIPVGRPRFAGDQLLKVARGCAGDVVTRQGQHFFVNGLWVGTAKRRLRSGAMMEAGPVGTVPVGHYYLASPHPDGYDSRYAEIGWVPEAWVVGRAWRLL